MAALIRGWAREPSENWRAAVANGTWMAGWFQRIRLYDVLDRRSTRAGLLLHLPPPALWPV